MRVAVHDAGHVALRRGVRAAVALPVALFITSIWLDKPAAAAFAAFGTTGLLITTDFAGSARRRLSSYLASGIVGTLVIVLGWAASRTVVAAVVATAAIGFAVVLIGVMRGSLALAAPALLVAYLVAVNLGGPGQAVPEYLLGWWIAVLVSTTAALTLLPRDHRLDVRSALAECLDRAADVVSVGWDHRASESDRDAAAARFHESVTALDAIYRGQPFRPAGATGPDRALALLVEHVHTAQLVLQSTTAGEMEPATGRPSGDAALSSVTVDALRSAATALRDPRIAPSAATLDSTRASHRVDTEAWVRDQRAQRVDTTAVETGIRAAHIARMAALLVEQIVELVRRANRLPEEHLAALPLAPARSWWSVLSAHLGWHSPWFRAALRSSIALAIAIGVVSLFGVAHGVWVLLGVMSVLRFDSSSTRRFAWQAIVGTTLGVLVGSVFVWLSSESELLLWIVLPIAVFMAGWGPAAINYLVGQSAFSAYVIIMLAIVDWPPDLALAAIRIEDIAIGGTVAVTIGLLLWPGGAAQALAGELRTAVRASDRYLASVLRAMRSPVDAHELVAQRHAAVTASVRAAETHDIALMQGGASAPNTPRWAQLTCATSLLVNVGDVLSNAIARDGRDTPVLADEPQLAALVAAASDRSSTNWAALAAALGQPGAATALEAEPHPELLPGVDLDADEQALVIALWTVDWLDHLDRLTDG